VVARGKAVVGARALVVDRRSKRLQQPL
jgi:hypothetical protein